jgi:hypothetical protein
MNYIQKLSLYIKPNNIDGDLKFDVAPFDECKEDNGVYIFTLDHDARSTTLVRVKLLENLGQQSHLQIEKIELNNTVLNNFDRWARYVTPQGTIPGTYGYMGMVGEYVIKIHQNALVHNYMTYFLSRLN